MSLFSIGCDPEFFLHSNGGLKSAIPLIKGTKHCPQPLPSGGNVQRDNVAIEFGTVPVTDMEEFVKVIRETINDIRVILPDNFTMLPIASGYFPKEELNHPEAKMFGCDPDFDAWDDGRRNVKPESAKESTFRTCGGHIHVGQLEGYEFLNDFDGKREFIKVMDLFLGIASVILDNSKEATERKKLYGKAGCFRETSYGIEYRTLSNFWVKSPAMVRLMYSLTQDALENMEKNGTNTVKKIGESASIQSVINGGLVEPAYSILKQLRDEGHLSTTTLELWEKALDENMDFTLAWSV